MARASSFPQLTCAKELALLILESHRTRPRKARNLVLPSVGPKQPLMDLSGGCSKGPRAPLECRMTQLKKHLSANLLSCFADVNHAPPPTHTQMEELLEDIAQASWSLRTDSPCDTTLLPRHQPIRELCTS